MNEARIRQQGFDDHGGGYQIYDNPYDAAFDPHYWWEEGWYIRENQKDMFKELEPAIKAEDESCQTFCPHCGMGVKVTLE